MSTLAQLCSQVVVNFMVKIAKSKETNEDNIEYYNNLLCALPDSLKTILLEAILTPPSDKMQHNGENSLHDALPLLSPFFSSLLTISTSHKAPFPLLAFLSENCKMAQNLTLLHCQPSLLFCTNFSRPLGKVFPV